MWYFFLQSVLGHHNTEFVWQKREKNSSWVQCCIHSNDSSSTKKELKSKKKKDEYNIYPTKVIGHRRY